MSVFFEGLRNKNPNYSDFVRMIYEWSTCLSLLVFVYKWGNLNEGKEWCWMNLIGHVNLLYCLCVDGVCNL